MLIGADPDQLDALGNQLDSWALTLDQIRGRVGGVLEQLLWQGADAHEFFEQWADRFAGMVGSAASGLREEAQCLHAEAAQQRAASDGGTGSNPFGPLSSLVGLAGGALKLADVSVVADALQGLGLTSKILEPLEFTGDLFGPLAVAVNLPTFVIDKIEKPNSPETLTAGVDTALSLADTGLDVAASVGEAAAIVGAATGAVVTAPAWVGVAATAATVAAVAEGANVVVSHFDPNFDEQVLHVAEKPDVIFASGVKGALSLVRSNPLNWVPAL